VIFIVNLFGAWIKEKEELLLENTQAIKYLFTYFPEDNAFDLFNEVISFSTFDTVLYSVSHSQRIMMLWIALLRIYLQHH
jgi:hypothetical protein